MVLFLTLYEVVVTFESLGEISNCDHSNTEKLIFEQYFPVVLFLMLYKVALTFETVDEIRT